jgi:hypothetical protein
MAYCLVADIQNLMGVTFTSTSRPKTAEVETAITSISADIDGVLKAAGYAPIPVTDADALSLLRQYVTMGVAARAWHTGYLSDSEPPRVTYWRQQYETFLSRIRNGTQVLPGSGADPAVAPTSIADYVTRGDSLVDQRGASEWTRRTFFDH